MSKNSAELPLRVVVAGHVDHGKSTLIGRLLHEMNALSQERLEAAKRSCEQRGVPFEWAFVTDALQAERGQNVTIEASQAVFYTPRRRYVLMDAPGHAEFLRNMVSAASGCDFGMMLIDATEGAVQQSRLHAALLRLLGVRTIALLVTKMDAVDFSEAVFQARAQPFAEELERDGFHLIATVPLSAREGDNLTERSRRMEWYRGMSLMEMLDTYERPAPSAMPLRFSVQDVHRVKDRRILAGRVESGTLTAGDTLLFSPGGQRATLGGIERWGGVPDETRATAGESIGITLAEPLFIERGATASHVERAPLETNRFRARIFWLGTTPLTAGTVVSLRIGTLQTQAELTAFPNGEAALEHGGITQASFHTHGAVPIDRPEDTLHGTRFALLEGDILRGGGVIDTASVLDHRARKAKSGDLTTVELRVNKEERARANGHKSGVVWFTGLSGAGKSTLAVELQRRLFQRGCQAYVLDGDNLRTTLSKDLGFSAADRSENIRRAGEVAALFADSGMIVIVALISPFAADRERARSAAGGAFHLVHIKADLATCEARDTKGLYGKARAGLIDGFTGISAPYEPPQEAELVLDTAQYDLLRCMEQLEAHVERHFLQLP